MGCTSSTEVSNDPYTGQTKTKNKLGGAYPGQRRPNMGPHAPDASQFGKDGQAVVHFKAYGGGNALTLVKQDGSNAPQGGSQPQYIQVTLPDGVVAGQTIHVQAPDGAVNAIVVPPGFGPGSTFTVEFAPEEKASQSVVEQSAVPAKLGDGYSNMPIGATTPAPPQQHADDGFASGFGNPTYKPNAGSYLDNFDQQYPTSTATPIYK